jgi:hypothetical protein
VKRLGGNTNEPDNFQQSNHHLQLQHLFLFILPDYLVFSFSKNDQKPHIQNECLLKQEGKGKKELVIHGGLNRRNPP